MRNLFIQNKIAMVWDFDKTLIPYNMQRPIFEQYGVDEDTFWRESNALEEYYRAHGYELVSRDQMYLLHILAYVKAGRFKGLTNGLLRQLGARLTFFEGLPDFFEAIKEYVESVPEYRAHDIAVEHYVVSSGLRQMILGSAIAPHLDGVWACEYLERAPSPGFLDGSHQELPSGPAEISQIIYAVDNTTKTRAIFEINKGTNFHPEIDVNAAIPREDRRVPIENMIYIADGPSDVPVFSVVNQNGGKTLGVYNPGSSEAFRNAYDLQRQRRVQSVAPADYRPGSQAYLWLVTGVDEIAQGIVDGKRRHFRQRVGRPPVHQTEESRTLPLPSVPFLPSTPLVRAPLDCLDSDETLLSPAPGVPDETANGRDEEPGRANGLPLR